MGNLRSLLHNAVQKHPSVEVIQVAANISVSQPDTSINRPPGLGQTFGGGHGSVLIAQFHLCMGENPPQALPLGRSR
jgi:hypothetical protein